MEREQNHSWRDERGAIALVLAITLVGLALRLPSFGDSLFGDELSAYFIVAGHSFGQMMHLLNNHSTELNPPLFFMLTWLSQKLFGLSAETMKLVSLVAGTVTIPLTYALGRRTVSAMAGIVASALVATCPFLIYYSTEARPYALMVLLVLLSALALLKALRSTGWWWWAAYAVCVCAAAYTHFTTVFALAALFAWGLITQPRARRRLLLASAAAAIGFLPWLPVLIKTSNSRGTKIYELLEPFSLHSIRIDLGHWAIGHPYLLLSQVPGSTAAVFAAVAVALGLVGAGLRLIPRLRRRPLPLPSPELALVVVFALAAPVGVALYSALRESVWGARNVISSWAGFAVLLGALVSYPKTIWRLPATGLLLVAFAIGGLSMVPASNHRPDYQDAIAYIDSVGAGPIADLVAPTPGPPTETEAALALAGSARAHPVFRIGLPTLKAVLAAPPYTPLRAQSGEVVAAHAVAAAGNGLLFIVAPTSVPIASLQSARRLHAHSNASQLAIFGTFLGALPARFHPVRSRTFAGLAPVTVYVYSGS
jgi:4-amino-4-deoxy-L-arabinose transferase-like glycosyltransferase